MIHMRHTRLNNPQIAFQMLTALLDTRPRNQPQPKRPDVYRHPQSEQAHLMEELRQYTEYDTGDVPKEDRLAPLMS